MPPRQRAQIHTDEVSGKFEIAPEVVLFGSLSFIGLVICLHIGSKFLAAEEPEMEVPPDL